jgi:hypothetical protein
VLFCNAFRYTIVPAAANKNRVIPQSPCHSGATRLASLVALKSGGQFCGSFASPAGPDFGLRVMTGPMPLAERAESIEARPRSYATDEVGQKSLLRG